MTGVVIPFPGINPAAIRPKPTSMDDLREGQHALVITRNPQGFAVEVMPGEPDWRRRASFATHRQAVQFARRSSACSPTFFPLILDETIEGRTSLDQIIGLGRDPMGLEGAA